MNRTTRTTLLVLGMAALTVPVLQAHGQFAADGSPRAVFQPAALLDGTQPPLPPTKHLALDGTQPPLPPTKHLALDGTQPPLPPTKHLALDGTQPPLPPTRLLAIDGTQPRLPPTKS
jgi:hypothetical protein